MLFISLNFFRSSLAIMSVALQNDADSKNLRQQEFSSENFKIQIDGLPKHFAVNVRTIWLQFFLLY